VNGLKSTLTPQLFSAKKRADRLVELGRLNPTEVRRLHYKIDELISWVSDLEEVEVVYGETSSDQAGE
jgi:hypothetical protein